MTTYNDGTQGLNREREPVLQRVQIHQSLFSDIVAVVRYLVSLTAHIDWDSKLWLSVKAILPVVLYHEQETHDSSTNCGRKVKALETELPMR